jgi:DnaJ-class molecular chaperone
MNCETCNGKGYIHTAVYHHPTIPDGTERVEVCDECKHNNQ